MPAPNMTLCRPPEPAPTKDGWFYGHDPRANNSEIIPWLVLGAPDDLTVCTPVGLFPVSTFRWFGAVPVCVEAVIPK